MRSRRLDAAVVAVLRRGGDGDGADTGRPHDGQGTTVVGLVRRRSERLLGAGVAAPEALEHSGSVNRNRHRPVLAAVQIAVGVDEGDVEVREVAVGGVDPVAIDPHVELDRSGC